MEDNMKDDHNCKELKSANEFRKTEHEQRVIIYKDVSDDTWVQRVGIEFIAIEFCPFCGEELNG